MKYGKVVKATRDTSSLGGSEALIFECPHCQNYEACMLGSDFHIRLDSDGKNGDGEVCMEYSRGTTWTCIKCELDYQIKLRDALQTLLDSNFIAQQDNLYQQVLREKGGVDYG